MLVVGALACLHAQAQTVLINFSSSGTLTPDTNGNYWNRVTQSSSIADLVDDANAATGFSFDYTANATAAAGSSYAPAATVASPFDISDVFDSGVYVSGSSTATFTLSGLNTEKVYHFALFAARSATANRTTTFTLTGANSDSGSVQTSGTDLGGSGVHYNVDQLVEIVGIAPTAGGVITVSFTGGSTFGYLNALSMTEADPPPTGGSGTIVIFR